MAYIRATRCGYQIKAKFVALIKRVTSSHQNFKEIF